MPIVPLHLHSHWSLLDGVPSIRQIVDFAQTLNLPALALTDTNALYGAVEFASACREADLRPIIGAELSITGGHSVILLAQSREGYANLCRLVTRLQAAPDREASLARGLSFADLAAPTTGARSTDACVGSTSRARRAWRRWRWGSRLRRDVRRLWESSVLYLIAERWERPYD